MGQEQENVAKLQEAYRQWNDTKGASIQTWMDLMTEDVRFRSLAGGAAPMEFTLECCSKQDVGRYFQGLGADWEMIHYTPEDYIAQGDRVAVRGSCSFKNRKTGKVLETPKADFFTFKKGKIADFFEFYDTAKAFAGAF
jgi:uncharacterized protein